MIAYKLVRNVWDVRKSLIPMEVDTIYHRHVWTMAHRGTVRQGYGLFGFATPEDALYHVRQNPWVCLDKPPGIRVELWEVETLDDWAGLPPPSMVFWTDGEPTIVQSPVGAVWPKGTIMAGGMKLIRQLDR